MGTVHTSITEEVLDVEAICRSVDDPSCGGIASFVGVVRDHDSGSGVVGIDYSAHPSADQILRDIAMRIGTRPGVHAVTAWHRTGYLRVGDPVMVVAVAAEHRAQAFAGVQAVVEDVKASLPVWKKQILTDGSHSWSGLP